MEENRISVKVSDEVLRGFYANLIQISHGQEEFVLDFISVFPPSGILGSRIIISPSHIKRAIKALQENLDKYEENFGTVEETEPDLQRIGFKME